MKQCNVCGKQFPDSVKFCDQCGRNSQLLNVDENPQTEEKKCNVCGKIFPASAKFCDQCGRNSQLIPVANAMATGKGIINSIINSVKPNKEEPATAVAPSAENQREDLTVLKHYIQWNVLDGQIAVKFDENDLVAYGKVKGVRIQHGVKALLFVDKQLVAELDSGNYSFRELGIEKVKEKVPNEKPIKEPKESEDKPGIFTRAWGFVRNLFHHAPEKTRENVERIAVQSAPRPEKPEDKGPSISIVLVRDNYFPLVFNIENIETAQIRSEVGVHILCHIENVMDFYVNNLLEKKFVSYVEYAKVVEPLVRNALNMSVRSVHPNDIATNMSLFGQVQQNLQLLISQAYPYISVQRVIDMSASQGDLEKIRSLKEVLYVSEQELEARTKFHHFENRLKDEENAQALHTAKTQVEFAEAMAKLDQQNDLNTFEREKFATMLSNQRRIHEAKSEEEVESALQEIEKTGLLRKDELDALKTNINAQRILREAASEEDIDAKLHEYRKKGLLRDEEIDNIEHAIKQRADLRDLNDEQILALATLENEQALERQKINWEFETGVKRLENELQLRRIQEAYDDERWQKEQDREFNSKKREDDYSDSRREKDAAFNNAQRESDLDYTTRASAAASNQRFLDAQREAMLKEQAESADFARQMEMAKWAAQTRAQNQDHEARMQGSFADRAAHEAQMANIQGQNQANLFQGRSAEEIMALKGNLDSSVMAAKYNAEAQARIAEANANAAMMQNGQLEAKNQQMFDMMQKMLSEKNADKDNQNAMMMQMMQMMNANNQNSNAQSNANMQQMMQMMAQMGMTGMQAAAGAQANANAMNANMQNAAMAANNAMMNANVQFANEKAAIYQQQSVQNRADSNADKDRFLQGMQTTIQSVGGAISQQPSPHTISAVSPQVPANFSTQSKCPSCGATLTPGAKCCTECGELLV